MRVMIEEGVLHEGKRRDRKEQDVAVNGLVVSLKTKTDTACCPSPPKYYCAILLNSQNRNQNRRSGGVVNACDSNVSGLPSYN
jgi:hypothetical protein